MKKIIKTALLTSCILSSSALAEGIYGKGTIGFNTIADIKKQKADQAVTIRLKDNFPVIGGGVGYEFDNYWRVEGVFDYYFLFSQKEKSQNASGTSFNLNLKTKISDLMVNIYKGFPVNESFKVFAGGGIGVAHLKDKAKGYALETEEEDVLYHRLPTTKGKQIYNTAYRATVGVDYKLGENTTTELSYNYLCFGKNKPKVVEGVENITKRNFSVHNLSLGIRVYL